MDKQVEQVSASLSLPPSFPSSLSLPASLLKIYKKTQKTIEMVTIIVPTSQSCEN